MAVRRARAAGRRGEGGLARLAKFTLLTHGCYRLHPVEWNIGEAAGVLAACSLEHGVRPSQVRATAAHLAQFQQLLGDQAVEVAWPTLRAVDTFR